MRAWLEQHDVPYEERDITEPRVADEAKRRYGVRIAPITVIGDAFHYGTAERQIPNLREAFADATPR